MKKPEKENNAKTDFSFSIWHDYTQIFNLYLYVLNNKNK